MTDRDAALTAWWSASLGSALLAAESELLGEALEDVFGWELLQIGAWGTARELLAGSRTRRQTTVATPGFPYGADILGRPSQLPVSSDSVEAVILPHTLEFASDPYAIVREVDRVLVGEGQLLVLGFRPWSLWGMRATGWCCSVTKSSPRAVTCTAVRGARARRKVILDVSSTVVSPIRYRAAPIC
jgi:hypothetical protein